MARKKSLNELREQYKRIIDSGDWNRIAKASEILTRYEKNIKKTESYKEANREIRGAWVNGRFNTVNSLASQALNQQYSQRTYMGLSNG